MPPIFCLGHHIQSVPVSNHHYHNLAAPQQPQQQPALLNPKPSAYNPVNINADGSPLVPSIRLPATTEHQLLNPALSSGLIIEIPGNLGVAPGGLGKRGARELGNRSS